MHSRILLPQFRKICSFLVVTVVVGIASRFLVFSSLKICEELSANQKFESQQILSLQNRQVKARKRTVHQRFYPELQKRLFFLLLPLTTEAMGIWRFAGAFAVVERQSECGSKTAGMHVSQPVPIGVCYGHVIYFIPS